VNAHTSVQPPGLVQEEAAVGGEGVGADEVLERELAERDPGVFEEDLVLIGS
jgi:hypothetical protein